MSERPRLEVAEVLRSQQDLLGRSGTLSPDQHRVLGALTACRTALLGGHLERCDDCGHERPAYNSCRNRHCPKCQGSKTVEWLQAQQANLLPVPYSHAVFTLPHLLAPIALQNPRLLYGFLFQASAQALLELARGDRHLGGHIGFLSILHTWGQTLLHHPHIHCLIPAGVLSLDGSRWIHSRPGFLLPVRPLSRLFRGKFLALLENAYNQRLLSFHGQLAALAQPDAFKSLIRQAREKEWVVYLKPPFGGPEQALKYLARYTHRVAIANSRLLALDGETVTFSWKDYAHGSRPRTMRLTTAEFSRRFLLHVLPAGFVRIRHYGFLANRNRAEKLERCRLLIAADPVALPPVTPATHDPHDPPSATDHAAADPLPAAGHCPLCRRGRLRVVRTLPPLKPRRGHPLLHDTS